MSFEGYYQLLCTRGHLFTVDCYRHESHESALCPYCGSEVLWWNLVDTTNDDGNPIVLEKFEPKFTKYNIPLTEGYIVRKFIDLDSEHDAQHDDDKLGLCERLEQEHGDQSRLSGE